MGPEHKSSWSVAELQYPLQVFAASRVAMALIGWLGLTFSPSLFNSNSRAFPDALWLDALFRWDCAWYARIAAEGYVQLDMANFWPLLPVLTSAISRLGLRVEAAQTLVAAAFHLGALGVLYRLFSRVGGDLAARWGLAFYAAYPFAFFQGVPYAEGMLTFFTAAAVLAALEGKAVAVAVMLSLGVLTRHVGALALLAVAPLLWVRGAGKSFPARLAGLWPVLVVPLVVLGWAAFLQARFNVPFAFIKAREHWGAMAYWSILEWNTPRTHLEHKFFIVVSALLALGALSLTSRIQRWFGVMGLVSIGMLWAVGVAALARYSSSVWPLFLGVGMAASRFPGLAVAVLATSIALQAFWFDLYAHAWWIF